MAKAKPEPKSPFAGRCRMVSRSAWDEDFIDEMDPARAGAGLG